MSGKPNASYTDIDRLTAAELAEMPSDLLREFQNALDNDSSVLKTRRNKFKLALETKYGDRAQKERLAAGKDSGRVTLKDHPEAPAVLCEAKKTVEWDQDKLQAIAEKIAAHNDNPTAYMKITYVVREANYNDWPPNIRAVFDEARTVKIAPSFKIVEAKEK